MSIDRDFVSQAKQELAESRFSEAMRTCRVGLLANPTHVEARLVLAMALLALRRFDDVLAETRIISELAPAHPLWQVLRSEARVRKGDVVTTIGDESAVLVSLTDEMRGLLAHVADVLEHGPLTDERRDNHDTREFPSDAARADSAQTQPRGLLGDKGNPSDHQPASPGPAPAQAQAKAKATTSSDEKAHAAIRSGLGPVSASVGIAVGHGRLGASGRVEEPADATFVEPTRDLDAPATLLDVEQQAEALVQVELAEKEATTSEVDVATDISHVETFDAADASDTSDETSIPGGPAAPDRSSAPGRSDTVDPGEVTDGTGSLQAFEGRPEPTNGGDRDDTSTTHTFVGEAAVTTGGPLETEVDPRQGSLTFLYGTALQEEETGKHVPAGEVLDPEHTTSERNATEADATTGVRVSDPEAPTALEHKPGGGSQVARGEALAKVGRGAGPTASLNGPVRDMERSRADRSVEAPPSASSAEDAPTTARVTESKSPSSIFAVAASRSLNAPSATGGKMTSWTPSVSSEPRNLGTHLRSVSDSVVRSAVAVGSKVGKASPLRWVGYFVGLMALGGIGALGVKQYRDYTLRKTLGQAVAGLVGGNVSDHKAAEEALLAVLRKEPHNADALAELALVRAAIAYEFDEPNANIQSDLASARTRAQGVSIAIVDAADVYVKLALGEAADAEKRARDAATRNQDTKAAGLLGYLVGRSQLALGKARAAADSFKDALKWNPDAALTMWGLGTALTTMGNDDEAIAAFQNGLRKHPKHVGTRVALASLSIARRVQLGEAQAMLEAVIGPDINDASQLEQAEAYVSLAELGLVTGHLEKVEQQLETAEKLASPRSVEIWTQLSRVHRMLGDLGKAEQEAERALAIAPSAVQPQLASVAVLLDQGRLEPARRRLESLSLTDSSVDTTLLRVRLSLLLGHPAQAEQELAQIVRSDEQRREVLLIRSQVAAALGDRPRALGVLRGLADRYPTDGEIMGALGLALAEAKDPDAPAVLERAAKLDPGTPRARMALVKLLRERGDLPAAATHLEAAVSVHPSDEALRVELGQVLFDMGELERAQVALDFGQPKSWNGAHLLLSGRVAAASGDREGARRFAERGPSKGIPAGDIGKLLAEAALQAGLPSSAIDPAKRAMALSPRDPEATAVYTLALAQTGHVDQALSLLQSAIAKWGSRVSLLQAQARISIDQDEPDFAVIEQAIEAARLEKSPPRVQSDLLTLQGRAYYWRGQVKLALRSINAAITLSPHNAFARYIRGLMLVESDRPGDALDDIRMATLSRPPLPSAYYQLGRLLAKRGDVPAAKRAFAEYLRLAGNKGEYAEDVRKELSGLN